MHRFKSLLGCLTYLCLLAGIAQGATLSDPDFGFKIEIPEGWTGERVVQGEDRVLQFQSPDGNAYGEVRVFPLASPMTATQLRQAFGEATMAQAEFAGAGADELNGIAGEVAAWRMASGGVPAVVGGFFFVQDSLAYVLLTITAESSFSQYSPIFDQIFGAFSPGRQLPPPTAGLPEIDRTGTALHAGLVAQAHPELGFVIVHSDAWSATQPAPYSVRIAPVGLDLQDQPSVLIEALSGNAYPSLQSYAAALKSQLSTEPGIRFDQEGPHRIDTLEIGGVPLQGWSLGASYVKNGTQFRHIFYLFKRVDPSVYYGVYIAGPTAAVLKYQPEMMGILATLKMIPFQS